LQPRRKVRRLAYNATLLRLTRPDQVADDDPSSGDTNPRLERSVGLEPLYRRDQLQASAHRALGVVHCAQ
jgi:hypothetical protein